MRVFKYRSASISSLRRDIRCLFENKIYSASVDSLNDVFESRVQVGNDLICLEKIFNPQIYKDEAGDGRDGFFDVLLKFLLKVRRFGVYSMSATPIDELLWAYYGGSHEGFCIEYDLNRLIDYGLEGQDWVNVDYQSEIPVIVIKDLVSLMDFKCNFLKKVIGTKSKKWSHEKEVRVITGSHGYFEYDFRAVKAIYFGLRSSGNLRRRIMRVMAGRGIEYYRIVDDQNGYKLSAIKIEDQFASPVVYRSRCAPVDDGVPYLDEKSLAHKHEIYKAIKLVRRDPYCDRVLDAYISSKSSEKETVYYVTYQRSDGKVRNRYVSKFDL